MHFKFLSKTGYYNPFGHLVPNCRNSFNDRAIDLFLNWGIIKVLFEYQISNTNITCMHHQALSICLLRNKLTCLPILPLCPRSAILWLELVAIAGSVLFFSSFPQHSSRFLLAVSKSCICFYCCSFWIRRSPVRSHALVQLNNDMGLLLLLHFDYSCGSCRHWKCRD